MSDEWPEQRLGDLALKIGSGATPRGGKGVYQADGIPLIRSQNVYDNHFDESGLAFIDAGAAALLNSVTVFPGDVLLNITGDSVARCCLAPAYLLPARVNQHVMIVRPDPDRLDGHYLQGLLSSPTMKRRLLALSGAGSTRPALTKAHVQGLKLSVPPLPEQRAIGEVLGAIHDKIEANRLESRLLAEIRDSFLPKLLAGEMRVRDAVEVVASTA